MTYLPSKYDLALLNNHSSNIYCRIDLLNKDFVTIGSLEGVVIDGSVSIDSESDVRRTFNVTMYLGTKSDISSFEQEEWVNKNVRVFIGLAGRSKSKISTTKSIDEQVREDSRYQVAETEYQNVLNNIITSGYAKYGNIDNMHRDVLVWSRANISKYHKFFDQINDGTPPDDPDEAEEWYTKQGDYSTVLGSDDPICQDGPYIAFTPMFQTGEGLIPLVEDDIWGYLDKVAIKAKSMSGGLSPANIFKVDSEGLYTSVYDVQTLVHGMIGAVEGMTLNGRTLSKVDVSAIAGWSEDELRSEYGQSSVFVGHSMHDIQAEVIDGQTDLNRLYSDLYLEYSNNEDTSYFNKTKVYWYNEGCYAFSSNGFTYSATENTVQASCVDLVSLLNGDLGGQLVGGTHRMEKNTRIADSIYAVMKESDFPKVCIDYWSRDVPHDLDYDTGSTMWDILTELRDLYYPFEMYFDDDTFVCKEIPSGFDDPPVLSPELFASLVTSDGESATIDYTTVRNCVELFGATIDADTASTTTSYAPSTKTLSLRTPANNSDASTDQKISFVATQTISSAVLDGNDNVKSGELTVTCTFTYEVPNSDNDGTTTKSIVKTSKLYRSLTDANGDDILQDPGVIKAGKYYVLQWNPKTQHFYFLGQQQSHAMAKLVDEIPSAAEIEEQKQEDNCDNMAFICVNDPQNIDDLYNARLSIEKIGRRTEILSGGDYEGYTTDESAMEACQYELWKRARLTDGMTVTIRLVPWLDVNQKIQYAAKYLRSNTPVDWIIKNISMNLGEGTMSLTMSRYFPYYTDIVNNKYAFLHDNLMDIYFPELTTASTADN